MTTDKNADQFWSRYKRFVTKDLSVLAKTNIPQSTLSTWRNKGIYPRADEAVEIARAIHATVEYLVSGKTEAPEDPAALSPAALEIAAIADRVNEEGLIIIKEIIINLIKAYPKKLML